MIKHIVGGFFPRPMAGPNIQSCAHKVTWWPYQRLATYISWVRGFGSEDRPLLWEHGKVAPAKGEKKHAISMRLNPNAK